MAYGELQHLTRGERLLLDRRRRGERQKEAAARLGVSLSKYAAWETDRAKEGETGIPVVEIRSIKAHERCLLYRRRAGFTQEKVARDMGICRWWLNQMEQGKVDCTDLVCYWEQ